ncbi:MAG: hypothetical protein GY950_29335 [bacterium]|nr:hypothetical protein [bacterium]
MTLPTQPVIVEIKPFTIFSNSRYLGTILLKTQRTAAQTAATIPTRNFIQPALSCNHRFCTNCIEASI